MNICLAALLLFSSGNAQDVAGRWRAWVFNDANEQVEFDLDVSSTAGKFSGALVNGDDRVASSSGSFDGKTLRLLFDFYDAELTATLVDSELEGVYVRRYKKDKLTRIFHATRKQPPAGRAMLRNDITGDWRLDVEEKKGVRATWRATFTQSGGEVRGTLMPVSGDWGTLTGSFQSGELRMSRFDGIRALLLRARLTSVGKLEGKLNSSMPFLGTRAAQSSSKPTDPETYTRMIDPSIPLRFAFPDLSGKIVSLEDARFKNKVVVVTIMGSWCPNCHEEAAVLKELYERYHAKGLEIVALAFEYTGEVPRDREQVRRFVARHQIPYLTLLAGTTEEGEVERKLMLLNFGAYPTSLYVGRDGLVKKIHAGFDGPATGAAHERLKSEMDAYVRDLLAK
jgi:thiol-disulfide isomerase/thioredoxin